MTNPAALTARLIGTLHARTAAGDDTFLLVGDTEEYVEPGPYGAGVYGAGPYGTTPGQLLLDDGFAEIDLPASVAGEGSLWLRYTHVADPGIMTRIFSLGYESSSDPDPADNLFGYVTETGAFQVIWMVAGAPPSLGVELIDTTRLIAEGDTVDLYVEWRSGLLGIRVDSGPLQTTQFQPGLGIWSPSKLILGPADWSFSGETQPWIGGYGSLYVAQRALTVEEIGIVATTATRLKNLWLCLQPDEIVKLATSRYFTWHAEFWVTDINGVRKRDITHYVEDFTIDTNIDRAVKYIGRFRLSEAGQIRRYEDYVQASMHRVFEDGTEDDVPLGLYAFTMPKRYIGWEYTNGDWEGNDLTVLLANRASRDPYNIASGTNIRTAIVALIEACGITRHRIPMTTQTLDGDLTCPPGTTFLDIANDIAASANWYSLYPDGTGWLVTGPTRDKQYVSPWATLGPEDQFAEIVETPTDTQIRNVVVVRRLQPDKAPIYATAINDAIGSPTSTVTIGERPQTYDDNAIANHAAAQARADYLLGIAGSFYVTIDIAVLPDPTIALHQTVDIDFVNENGTDLSGRYWIRTWRMRLGTDPFLALQAHRMVPFVRDEELAA